MPSLTDFGAEQMLRWLTDQPVLAAPIGPLYVALLTLPGDDIAAGTEVVGGGYARQQFIPTVPATGVDGTTALLNSNLIRFNNMPAVEVQAFAIFDSARPTPIRWVHALLSSTRTFSLGDPAEFAVGDLVIAGD